MTKVRFECRDYPYLTVLNPADGLSVARFEKGYFETEDPLVAEIVGRSAYVNRLGNGQQPAPPKPPPGTVIEDDELEDEPFEDVEDEVLTNADRELKKRDALNDLVNQGLDHDILKLRGDRIFFGSRKLGHDPRSAVEFLGDNEEVALQIAEKVNEA